MAKRATKARPASASEAAPKRPPRRKVKAVLPTHVGTSELAGLFGITERRLNQLVGEGVIPQEARGTYPLIAATQAFFTYGRDLEKRKAVSSASERLKERKDEDLQRKMAREDRQLIDIDEAMTAMDEVVGLFVESLAGMPPRLSRDPKEQQRFADIFADERNRLADGVLEKAQALRTGLPASEDASEDDA